MGCRDPWWCSTTATGPLPFLFSLSWLRCETEIFSELTLFSSPPGDARSTAGLCVNSSYGSDSQTVSQSERNGPVGEFTNEDVSEGGLLIGRISLADGGVCIVLCEMKGIRSSVLLPRWLDRGGRGKGESGIRIFILRQSSSALCGAANGSGGGMCR